MTAPYTTDNAIRARLGLDRALALLDRDEDDDEDVGVASTGSVAPVDDAIRWADRRIEAALGVRYSVPFASLASTPAQVQELSCDGAIAYLYEWLLPGGKDAVKWRGDFDSALERFRTGEWIVVGGTRLDGDASTNSRAIISESGGLHYSGRIDDDYSDSGVDRNTI